MIVISNEAGELTRVERKLRWLAPRWLSYGQLREQRELMDRAAVLRGDLWARAAPVSKIGGPMGREQ